jgi:hypothetical protein
MCERLKALRLEAFVLAVAAMLAFTACNGSGEPMAGASSEPTNAGAQTVTLTPLPTVSPDELSTIGGDPPPPAGEIDPCTLITKAEAEEILELPVADVWRHTHFGSGNICEWYSRGNPRSSIFLRLDSGYAADELMAIYRMEGFGWGELQTLSGIGDSAYTLDEELLVFEQGTLFSFLVVVKDEPSLKAAKELALIALRRLPQYAPPSP